MPYDFRFTRTICPYFVQAPGKHINATDLLIELPSLRVADVPAQFMKHFDPRQPIVVGGLVKGEDTKSFVQARFQAHRWLKRVLKSNDPITLSIGWRRYQTVGVFSK